MVSVGSVDFGDYSAVVEGSGGLGLSDYGEDGGSGGGEVMSVASVPVMVMDVGVAAGCVGA